MSMIKVAERQGSSKDIIKVLSEQGDVVSLEFNFSDRVSVLDLGPIPNTPFPALGRLRCAIAGRLFQEMNALGFNTHYRSHNVKTATMEVEPFDIKELGVEYPASRGRILGIEIIDRRKVTDKLVGRVKSGTLHPKRLSKSLQGRSMLTYTPFRPPFVECTTKFTDADRYIDNKEAALLAGVGLSWLEEQCFPEIERASDFLFNYFAQFGFERHDGKFEGAILYTSKTFVFADSMSPDEMRINGPDGKSCDKDVVREWFQENHADWYAEVLAAKKEYPDDRSKWPTYPDRLPPPSVVTEVLNRYYMVAKAIGAIT